MTSIKYPIIQVNTSDIGGGAEKVAMDLHRTYIEQGLAACFLVGTKKSNLASIQEIPPKRSHPFWKFIDHQLQKVNVRGMYRIQEFIDLLIDPFLSFHKKKGLEYYQYPQSRKLINALRQEDSIIHLHNLHANFFDVGFLPELSNRNPVIITMHDEYLYTGHCAATLGCERWQIGCGDCPHLDVYPPVKKDNTRANWQKKKKIFSKSQLILVAPSKWLAQRVGASFLSDLPIRVIPNGIDLDIFKPASKAEARAHLGFPQEAFIMLFVARPGQGGHFKDYSMLEHLMQNLIFKQYSFPTIFLALGGETESAREINGSLLIEKPFDKSPENVARYYQASDVYIHPSKADNFPLVTLEAMGCGIPVVSTNVGGLREQIQEGINGFTFQLGDNDMLVNIISKLIGSPDMVRVMGGNSLIIVQEKFSLDRMVKSYLSLYKELLDRNNQVDQRFSMSISQ